MTDGSNCNTFLARHLVSSDCIKIIFGRVFSLTDGQIVMFLMTATDFDNIVRRGTRIAPKSCKNESKIRINIVFKKEVLLIIAAMKRFLEFVGNANRGWFFGIVIAQQTKKNGDKITT